MSAFKKSASLNLGAAAFSLRHPKANDSGGKGENSPEPFQSLPCSATGHLRVVSLGIGIGHRLIPMPLSCKPNKRRPWLLRWHLGSLVGG